MSEDVRGQAGGIARNKVLPAEQKQAIARKAARARWGIRATHKGTFLKDFGVDVDCYVLSDEAKTPVISQRGMGAVLGLSERGNALPRFLSTRSMAPYFAGAEMQPKLENPLKFQWGTGGADQPPSEVNGYDAALLIDICKAVIQAEADGNLLPSQRKVAQQAHIIMGASAKQGIRDLVYALSGYDQTKEEVVAAFKFYVREEARDYEREFPEGLYEQWYRLYQIPKPERNRPWKFKHLTVDQIYRPLAKSNGKILELTQLSRVHSSERYKKLHQFLSDIGVKALRSHLGQLLGIARISRNKEEYEDHFETLFGEQPDLFKHRY